MKEFKFIGQHPDELEGGRVVEPGEYTGPINERAKQNKRLINDELLIEVPDGTAQEVADANEAAAAAVGEDATNPPEEDEAR